MKTPEEIKKGLECCVRPECPLEECPYYNTANRDFSCLEENSKDALAYILWLEARKDGLDAPKVKYDLGWSIGVLYGLTARCSDETAGRLHEVIDALAQLACFKEE